MIKLIIQFVIAIFLLCEVVPKLEESFRNKYLHKFKSQIEDGIEKKLSHKISNGRNGKLLITAKKYLGIPYEFGGTSFETGIDCSFFVQSVCKENGINLPRTVRAQYAKCVRVWGNLEVGDLVFFQTYRPGPSHVGLYLGQNKFIHASSRAKKVVISTMSSYWNRKYIGARRILC